MTLEQQCMAAAVRARTQRRASNGCPLLSSALNYCAESIAQLNIIQTAMQLLTCTYGSTAGCGGGNALKLGMRALILEIPNGSCIMPPGTGAGQDRTSW